MKYVTMVTMAMVLFAGMSQAHAMCAYNKSDVTMTVFLDCGMFCENKWTIAPGGHKCREGKGGYVTYRFEDSYPRKYYPYDVERKEARVRVDEHGWTTTRKIISDSKSVLLELVSKDKNGNINYTRMFDFR